LVSTHITAESVREALSAAMDDQAQPLELQRVLKASQNDEQVRQQWARYQLASAALKREATSASIQMNLADKVRAAIDSEANHELSSVPSAAGLGMKLNKFWQPVAGLAVAASVTFVMVVGAQRIGVADQPALIPAQQGVVLLEPRSSNDSIQMSSSGSAVATQPQADSSTIIRTPAPQATSNASDARWLVNVLPEGFVLIHRSNDDTDSIPREVLTYSNGVSDFTIYVEALNGRSIAEGYAFVGSNLVLGQAMTSNGADVFVTFVGQLDLDQATQAANSVVGLQAQ